MIEKLFNKKTIELNVEVNDWIDAIRFCGSLFVKNGNTEAKYTDAMINTVKNMGQYIVIEKGIAMPHARPEDGVKKIGMGLIKLKKPIEFGNEEYDPVDILIFICAIDKTSHLKALAELMTLIEDNEFLSIVRNSSSKEDVLSYINSKSF
ncbi:PTS sugar transporter subunit IIA [Clostridium beijerinckii]|uniref:PTS system ascorbate-specific IIA component n=1 Tax=Clostridium beijerinckii TaxID=1520 RepID=A0A9Q5CTP7_CLOBE|nr:PTS sugar transporter subunit IIA [Clostridium beijerinckii]AQS05470.1 ascorbate-specific phosphotransferase enzyme IIA component [Clostridium beijerinckii]MBA2885029.1 PTS system ascorbate-specific IIA component [Clostridium beijerinckii]MBA2899597.1 PTS system ascorbate-specific IIA component [Clostridium beijerinckii]MBA2909380.1 PTS system ascorbate-specific IIA component [Clostridium beijerinckii]MBA9014953.1 PTS system ascorbate-specific IIA component [Clostridium beijerinckii]